MDKIGKVIQSTGKWYKVSIDNEIVDCRIPGKFRLKKELVTNPVAVGDNVTVDVADDGTGMITKVHDRRNYVPRKATHSKRGEQILAANIDRAWVVQSIRDPKIKTGFIDRFLVTCEAYHIPVGIIINKVDLASSSDHRMIQSIEKAYFGIGYPLIKTSINDKNSIQKLKRELSGKTSVFIGHSGVGKSSLINAIDPKLDLTVGEISDSSNKGKHTTTYARLVPIAENGFIVDTPGIREFGLVNIIPAELSLFFPEMEPYRDNCKFNNCTHYHEPQCAVVEAYEEGEIHPERYASYLNILESIR